MEDLREKGFEIGVHGLKHDGKLFLGKKNSIVAGKINRYLKQFGTSDSGRH